MLVNPCANLAVFDNVCKHGISPDDVELNLVPFGCLTEILLCLLLLTIKLCLRKCDVHPVSGIAVDFRWA